MPKRSQTTESKELHYIKSDSDTTPTNIIIEQAFNEIQRMGKMVLDNFILAVDAFYAENDDIKSEKVETVQETEATINYLNRQVASLLAGLKNVDSVEDMKKISTLIYIASDLERIGDHAENISEYNIRNSENELRLSPQAMEEMQALSSAVIDILTLTMNLFDTVTDELLQDIYHLERNIDYLTKKYTENHINRLKNEKIDPRGGVVFINMITNLERCGDHANNISYYFLEVRQFRIEA